MKSTVKTAAVLAIACGAAAVLLYLGFVDPATAPLPQCMFKRLTGFECPGCGTQRAIHALMHGHIGEAWHFNAALFPALALSALYALNPHRLRPMLYASATPWIIVAATVAWWIGRNVV